MRHLRINMRTLFIEAKELRMEVVDWIEFVQGRVHCEYRNESSGSINDWQLLD